MKRTSALFAVIMINDDYHLCLGSLEGGQKDVGYNANDAGPDDLCIAFYRMPILPCAEGLMACGKSLMCKLVAFPLKRFLLFVVGIPVGDRDVFALARQRIRYGGTVVEAILHVKPWRVALRHLLRGIVVTEEDEAIILSRAVLAIRETLHVVGNQFVLLVGFVPVAHFNFQQMLSMSRFVEHIPILFVDGEFVALSLRGPLAMPYPSLLEGVGRFVDAVIVVGCTRRKKCPGKIADGGLGALILHPEGILCRQSKQTAGKNDGQNRSFHNVWF